MQIIGREFFFDEIPQKIITFSLIPSGVLNRLARLTTRMPENEHTPLDKLYPAHADALQRAGRAQKEYPTLGAALDTLAAKQAPERGKRKSKSRQTYFCIKVSDAWEIPIHVALQELQNKYNLKWLRISMSYHRFSNLR